MQEFYLIGGMAIITFLIRYLPVAFSDRITLSPPLLRILNFVPPAVLSAIVVPAVLVPTGEDLWLSYTNPRLVGAIAAIATSWFTQNLLLTIIIGMAVFFSWQAVL